MEQRPAYVHIRLFKGASQSPTLYIAEVPADQKTYTWNVPNDKALLADDVYVSVSSEAAPPVGPGMGDNMGGNGEIFQMAADLPQPPIEAKNVDEEQEEEVETVTEYATETVKKTVDSKVNQQSAAAALSFSPAMLVLAVIPLALFL